MEKRGRQGNLGQSDFRPSPRRALVLLAWSFGIGWGLALLARIVLGPALPGDQGVVGSTHTDAQRIAYSVIGLLFLVLPAIVAVVLAHRWRVRLEHYGVPGRAPGAALWLAPLMALGLTVLAVMLPIVGRVSSFDRSGMGQVQRLGEGGRFVEALELKLDLEDQQAPLLHATAKGFVLGVTLGLLVAMGTELAWRGLLHVELRPMGRAWTALIGGLAGAAWWAPLLPMAVAAGDTAWPEAVLRLGAYAVLGIVLSWARAATGSVLVPAALVATWMALGEVPPMALRGGSLMQIELARLAAVVVVALGVLMVHVRGSTGRVSASRPEAEIAEEE